MRNSEKIISSHMAKIYHNPRLLLDVIRRFVESGENSWYGDITGISMLNSGTLRITVFEGNISQDIDGFSRSVRRCLSKIFGVPQESIDLVVVRLA